MARQKGPSSREYVDENETAKGRVASRNGSP